MAFRDLFADFPRENGDVVYINLALVRFVEPAGANKDKSQLWFASDHNVVVDHNPQSVMRIQSIQQRCLNFA
jgi:hypothetical protein